MRYFCVEYLTLLFNFLITVIMKTSLKRGEAIEKLKKILRVQSLDLVRWTVLDVSKFKRVYVSVISYLEEDKRFYQIIVISLQYGWIELSFENAFIDLQSTLVEYFSEISRQSSMLYWDEKEQ